MFSRTDLEELVTMEVQPAISIYLPTHVAGREVRQDPIRLKNLLSAVAERLGASRRLPEINALLSPAQRLVEDGAFWRSQHHEQQGLAIFLAPGFDRVYQLPIAVPEEMMLGNHFHIKPLLPFLENAGPFWLLTISASNTRLYQGSRWDFTTPPAEAAVVVGVGVPAPVWVYYPPPPPYVVYPPYLYPGAFFIGATFGPFHHRHGHHWR